MKKMVALISALAVLMITFSGCVGDNNSAANRTELPRATISPDQSLADVSELANLPADFEYVGSIPLNEEYIKDYYKAENVSGIVEGSEGLYKYNESDFCLDVIKLKDPEAANNFITTYKSTFPPLQNENDSRFVEESFNGHSAVRIKKYVTDEGKPVPRYIYIWSNENYVLVVSGNTVDNAPVKQLAEATGY
ncbi:MAG: hypothetical protein PHH67_08745 [Methanosarcina sp.]|jgi:hypothetical protein|nr:hypothetical protein [Methanosarcina sp.]MDD4306571.1 hypothetical protein [Methanosarcina sp.]MDD4621268.1 hypothetical protein [Methanosarcina sp.]NLN43764.1 hypothetical protein [Methanosarcina sp.]